MDQDRVEFSTSPVTNTREGRALYVNRNFQEAYTAMRWGIKAHKGLILVTGEPGTGKSALLDMTVERFEENVAAARVSIKPAQTFEQLLVAILIEYGLPVPLGKISQIQRLSQFFVEQHRSGRIVALLFDDAHNADRRMLDAVAIFTAFGKNNFPQLVFVGRPELATALKEPGLRLGEQIGFRSEITPLAADEVGRFIDHQLCAAGYGREKLFSIPAIEQIAKLSRGIPRMINDLCDRSLRIAHDGAQCEVSPETVRDAFVDLDLALQSNPIVHPGSAPFEKPEPVSDTAAGFVAKKSSRAQEQRDGDGNRGTYPRLSQVEPAWVGRTKRWLTAATGAVIATILVAGIGLVMNFKSPTGAEENPQQNVKAAVGISASFDSPTSRFLGDQVVFTSPEKAASAHPTAAPLDTDSRHTAGEKDSSALKATQKETIIFLHAAAPEDLPALATLGELLGESGFNVRQGRLSKNPTGGDVRFFFSQDRRSAEQVKATLQKELNQRGYRISLELLQRDGEQFKFAAPGNIEVWLPPLGDR